MKIKVAAIQMNCELANVDANLAKAEALLKEAVEMLGVNAETLEDILDEVYEAKDSIDTEEWSEVKEWYDKVIQ